MNHACSCKIAWKRAIITCDIRALASIAYWSPCRAAARYQFNPQFNALYVDGAKLF